MNIATAVNYQLPHQPLKTEGEVPEWLLLLPAGHFKGLDGRQWTNPDSQAVLNETKRYGLDLPVDIEHATQLKSPEGSYAGAIAWIPLEEIEIREGAIWGKVAWNDRGDWMVRGRDYRYYSPVFSFDAKDRVIRLISVGLTNRPNLPQLPALNHQQQTTEE
ncbi:MAG: phage protease, partial [Pseudomonadota bacterium]